MNYNFTEGMDRLRQMILAPPEVLPGPDAMLADRFSALAEDVERAASLGIFNPLPEEEPGDWRDASRIRTIRTRLAGLGYLPHDSGLAVIDPFLTHAVRQFQQDAALTADGWVGRQTWQALQELVSFESPRRMGRWFTGNVPSPALARAVALRLRVLGLTGDPPTAGLRHLQSIAAFLQLPGGEDIRAEVCPATIVLLFDQNRLIEALANGRLPADPAHPLFAFAACMARVELWLAGYDVDPAGWQQKEFYQPAPQILLLRDDSRLAAALTAYWQDHGKGEESRLLAQRFPSDFPAFFRMIAAAIRAEKTITAPEKSAMLHQLVTEQPEQLAAIWQRAQEMGGRTWDGMGRTAGWLHNLGRQPAGKRVGIGSNISRLVYHQAMMAYDTVRQALRDFPALLDRTTLAGELPGSDPGHIMLRHAGNLNFTVFVNSRGDEKKISQFIDQVEQTSGSFTATCRIIGTLMSTLNPLISQGRTGWTGLILALLRVDGRSNSGV